MSQSGRLVQFRAHLAQLLTLNNSVRTTFLTTRMVHADPRFVGRRVSSNFTAPEHRTRNSQIVHPTRNAPAEGTKLRVLFRTYSTFR